MEHYENENQNKNGGNKNPLKYFIVGILCLTLGTAIGSGASLYLLPQTSFFKNSSLYKSLESNNTNTSNTTVNPLPVVSKTQGLTVAQIAKKVGPAVVGVSTKTISQNSDESAIFGGSSGLGESEQEGMGSGIIFNEDGYILTNYHVISGAQQINVIFNNGKEYPAKIVNYDASFDLAVIKLTKKVTVPAVAELGDSSRLQVGDQVVAIGNPLGKELLGSVTTGIVSATQRQIDTGSGKHTLIQTDAAINAGNSGGPLINSLGQVVGINSAKIGGTGVEGIGFSIPINVVKSKISNLIKPILKIGIAATDITSDLSAQYNLPMGIYVEQVEEFSSAQKAGLQAGDVIVKFDGKKVTTLNEINTIKANHKDGDVVSIEINRDGKTKSLSLTLKEAK